MAYLAASDLALAPGPEEVAQVATPSHLDVVLAELMRLTLVGGDRSAYTAEQIGVADAALATVNAVIADTEQLIDGFLAMRYTLPLSPVPAIVRTWARDIVWYRLNQHRITKPSEDPVVRRYDDALKFLGLTRDGKFSLGVSDPIAADADSEVLIDTPGRTFTHATLADFG